jgi:uroporphyrin-3 C-methyltransferase
MNSQDEIDPTQDTQSGADAADEGKQRDSVANDTDAGPQTSTRGSGWPGWLALLVALLAVAGTSYLWLEQRPRQGLSDRVTGLQADLDTRNATLKLLRDSDRELGDGLNTLEKRVDLQLGELPVRITRLEGVLDNMPGVNDNARSAWLLAEAEYYMRIANAQLGLAGNVDVSLQALSLADEKLRDLGDPALTPIRALLSDERTALKAIPHPDTEGMILALSSLARALETLPLARSAPDQFDGSRNDVTPESGLERAWRVIVEALLGIIRVKHDDDPITPLMSESEESMLIRSLDIELQIARLAIIRNEARIYELSLKTVADRLERYFDRTSPAVAAALESVNELVNVKLPTELPDISGSLALLIKLGDERATP